MTASPLSGKGIWIRRIAPCQQGDLGAIVSRAQSANFTHVILKIADGAEAYNADPLTGDAPELIRRLRDAGLSVWGWHYLYGDKPRFKGRFQQNYHQLEAERAVQVIHPLREAGLQGYVMNAEGEYERAPRRADQAAEFVATVRAGLGDFPLALASWKFPNSHKRFPWAQFRQHGVVDLPQVFWLGRHREAPAQLEKSFQQYAALEPRLPYVPVAPAFFENDWRPSSADLERFIARALALGLPGFNLWAWDYLGLRGDEATGNPERLDFRGPWDVIAKTEWKEVVTVSTQPVSAERMPDEWVAEWETLTATDADADEDTDAGGPDWLREADVAELTEDDAEPARPFAPEAVAVELMPENWVAEWKTLTATDADADEDTDAGGPDWLREADVAELTEDDTEPARPFAPETVAVELMPEEWAAELAELTTDDADSELPTFGIEAEPIIDEEGLSEPELPEDLGDISFGLPTTAPEAEFQSAPLPSAEAEEIRARVQNVVERYADSFRDLRTAHRDQLIALGAQSLLGASSPVITLSGQMVGEAAPVAPSVEEKATAHEMMPEEWTAEWETLTATDGEGGDDADAGGPGWLREAEFAELTEDDAEPTRPFAPEAVASEMVPDEWVAEWETLTATDADADTDAGGPDWLRESDVAELTEEDAEPTRPFAPEAVASEMVPEEWVAELETLTATDGDDDTDAGGPDWLREADVAELTEEDAEPTRPFAPEAVAVELIPDELMAELASLTAGDDDEADADLPEWLQDFDIEAIEARLSEEDAEPTRPFTPEAEEFALALMPDELVAELASLTASDDGDAEADLPEWLRDFDIEAIEARLSEEDAEPARPYAPEPEAAIGTLIAPPIITTTTSPAIRKFFNALNNGRLEEAFRLYAPEFTLVHARHMARDRAGLRRFYLWLLPGLQRETLVVRSLHVNRLTVQAHWTCQNLHGRIIEGTDTFHLNRQAPAQIVYHHTTLDFDPDPT